MKTHPIFILIFFVTVGSFAQGDIDGIYNPTPLKSNLSKPTLTETTSSQNLVRIDNLGQIGHFDSLNMKILDSYAIMPGEIIYTMPIKAVESASRMPIHVPNPEINYTILEKKVGGVILAPRKD